ncbi:MAG: C10 family peptidase [Bacteroidales bacterium]|nr:C10 family peptidase [Bacteroidales bacterium]
MKTIKYFLLLLTSVFLIHLSFAEDVPGNKARIIAKNVYYERVNLNHEFAYHNIEFFEEYTVYQESLSVFHVFNLPDLKGYVLIAADDRSYPILAYSFSGNYKHMDPNQPPGCKMFIDSYIDQILHIKKQGLSGTAEIEETWRKYSSNDVREGSFEINDVPPLLTTKWGQGSYYNDSCPEDPWGPNGHVVTGCGAVVMCQVMKYYNYPTQGSGSTSYTCGTYGTLFAYFGATTYNWSNMPDSLTSYCPDIALIMFHCGVSVYMAYGPSSSWCYTTAVDHALEYYFNYPVTTHWKSNTSGAWEYWVREELDKNCPLIYEGRGSNNPGHFFVCDGYQNLYEFHFNWGWDGDYDGYYTLTNLNPDTYNFTLHQKAIFDMNPVPAITSDFSCSIGTVCAGESVSFLDNSIGSINSWMWHFPGGTPSVSTSQNPTVSYHMPGTYDVSLRVSDGMSSDSITKTDFITVKTLPSINLGADTTICDNHSIMLTAMGVFAYYEWFDGTSGLFASSVVVDSSGIGIGTKICWVEVTSLNLCKNRDTINVTFVDCSGIEDNKQNHGVTIYPNPNNGFLYLSTQCNITIESLMLIDIFGKQIMKRKMIDTNPDTSPTLLNLSQFPPGIYFLKMQTDHELIVKKIVIR